MISLIAAIGKNNELGKGNDLIFKLPADMKHFVKLTSGHPVIMGRKTFESLPNGALPKRRNIIITRDKNYTGKNIEVVHSLEEALALFAGKKEEVFIIGGAQIFKESMPVADRLYITHVEAEDDGADVFFPEIIPILWNETSREDHPADEKNAHAYAFSMYERFV